MAYFGLAVHLFGCVALSAELRLFIGADVTEILRNASEKVGFLEFQTGADRIVH